MNTKDSLFIGLMSGTSMDGIDAVLVRIAEDSMTLLDHLQHPYPKTLLPLIRRLSLPGNNEIDLMGEVDIDIAKAFAEATKALLNQSGIEPKQITAIGSHGQTIRHRPNDSGQSNLAQSFTLQIGDPNTLAVETGIPVIADFRRKDMALGGQGAPLAPAFHLAAFDSPDLHQVILNLGGIANITYLPAAESEDSQVIGFDTGPANTLLDAWYRKHHEGPFDRDGNWAQTGQLNKVLLDNMLDDPYFRTAAPKSTGKEYFSLEWLALKLAGFENLAAQDIQRTLQALTIESVAMQIASLKQVDRVYVCGGGALNTRLMQGLQQRLSPVELVSTAQCDIDPMHVEAMAFAWLANRRWNHLSGNIPSVTGASRSAVLGAIFLPD